MCLGAVHSFGGLGAVRFFLGFAEGSVQPAFIIITSHWYKRREHPIRVATWVSMSGVSQILGALIMYAIGSRDMAIASWRVLFLVIGGMTCVRGIGFTLLMPRNPSNAWFLNEHERELATKRLALDRVTRDRAEFNNAQLKEALLEPRTYLYFLMALCITLTTPILKVSAPQIRLVYCKTDIFLPPVLFHRHQRLRLLQVPNHACRPSKWRFQFHHRMSQRPFPTMVPQRTYQHRYWSCLRSLDRICSAPRPPRPRKVGDRRLDLDGCLLLALLSSAASMMASNVKGNTKKSVVSAGFFICYCIGCIIGPQAWLSADAPRYIKGYSRSVASWACLILVFIVYSITLRRENEKRNRLAEQGHEEFMVKSGNGGGHSIGVAVDSDLTETLDKEFRYTL